MSSQLDSQYKFDHVWFKELSAPLWERYVLPHFAKKTEPVWYLEIGVCEAMSLIWALNHLGKPGGLFVGVDPFLNSRHWHEQEGDGHKDRAIDNLGLWFGKQYNDNPASMWQFNGEDRPQCELHREMSVDYLLIENRKFDMLYIDGCHNADVAVLDILLGFRLLRDGGIMIVDDYDRKWRHGQPQVWQAVEAFELTCEGFYDRLYIHQKQIAFVKRPRRRRGYPPMLECGPTIEPPRATNFDQS